MKHDVVFKSFLKTDLGEKFIKKVVNKTLFFVASSKPSSVAVICTTQKQMESLARRYKKGYGKAEGRHALNVLSFNLSDGAKGSGPIGDIFIGVSTAKEEASAWDMSFKEYVALLIIHGILHLAGFEHEKDKKNRQKMEAMEEKILQSVFPTIKFKYYI